METLLKDAEIRVAQGNSPSTFRLDANRLLDTLRCDLGLANDAALSRRLDIGLSSISKLRHGRMLVTSGMLLKMHDATGKSIRQLRNMMGDTRCGYWPIRNNRAQCQHSRQ